MENELMQLARKRLRQLDLGAAGLWDCAAD
jgi:hypothetical protein